jgi:hypothetical protein
MAGAGLADLTKTIVIFGADPGREAGLVMCVAGKLVEKASVPADQAASWVATRLLKLPTGCHVIIAVERFQVGAGTVKKTQQSDPTEITGQLRYVARNSRVKFVLVNQSDSKKLGNDRQLRKAGWWTIGHGHINDAARVALHTLAVYRPDVFARLLDL